MTKLVNLEKEKKLWERMCGIKTKIENLLKSTNTGICTHSVKFLETLLLTWSDPTVTGNAPPFNPGGFELSSIPEENYIITRSELATQGKLMLNTLFKRLEDESLPASNVTAIINSLTVIVKQRTQFIAEITDILVDYHTNIPETLTKTQKKSITYALKMAMNVILKLHINGPWNDRLQQCLSGRIAKGAKRKSMSQDEFGNKVSKTQTRPYMTHTVSPSGIPINASTKFMFNPQTLYYVLQLPTNMAADLVIENLRAMVLPTTPQPGISPLDPRAQSTRPREERTQDIIQKEIASTKESTEKMEMDNVTTTEEVQEPKVSVQAQSIGSRSVSRILRSTVSRAKRLETNPNASFVNESLVSKIVSILPLDDPGIQLVYDFISHSIAIPEEDIEIPMNNGTPTQAQNIILYWLNLEYARLVVDSEKDTKERYNIILNTIIRVFQNSTSPTTLLSNVMLNAPYLTDDVFDVLKNYSQETEKLINGLSSLRDLVVLRPFYREKSLDLLLTFISHEDDIICTEAIKLTTQKKVLQSESVFQRVKAFAIKMMNSIITEEYETFVKNAEAGTDTSKEAPANPVEEALKEQPIVQEINAQLVEKDIHKKLLLFTALCLKRHELISDYLYVLNQSNIPQVKKVMLQIYNDIIRKIGMNSEGLLAFIASYPSDLERYILRALHVLTEKNDPTPSLVKVVLDVYKNIKSDARLLIFILSGLTREEAITYLPKIVSLPKEDLSRAIYRLLDPKRSTPLKPADLLVQLHLINPEKHNITWEKLAEATQFCFSRTEVVVNKEVLASVLQQLVDITPLPLLFLRTVNQTIEKCGELLNFVLGILSRLVTKQIWTDNVRWRGFVKACSKALPHSIQVILQLPGKQFENILNEIPDLRARIIAHLEMTNKMNMIPKELQRILDVQN